MTDCISGLAVNTAASSSRRVAAESGNSYSLFWSLVTCSSYARAAACSFCIRCIFDDRRRPSRIRSASLRGSIPCSRSSASTCSSERSSTESASRFIIAESCSSSLFLLTILLTSILCPLNGISYPLNRCLVSLLCETQIHDLGPAHSLHPSLKNYDGFLVDLT